VTDDDINRRVAAILKNSLVPSSPSQVEKWRLLARNVADVESVDEGLDFITEAILTAEDEGRDAKWPEDFKQFAVKWRKTLGPRWRKRHANKPQSGETPPSA
jgi:hypothetical protein